MGTVLLLIITTMVGAFIGHMNNALPLGAIVGFFVGLLLRAGMFDAIGDLLD